MTTSLPPGGAVSALPDHLPSRGRRASRPSGDDREVAILTTAERLLEQRPLAEISVDDLAKGAGISRPTFYFYFPSKDAVLLTLVERVIAEADAALAGLPADLATDQPALCRATIKVLFEVFGAHRAVTLAGAAARANNVEMRELWAGFMQKWIDETEATIRTLRDLGTAPDTVPARDLAISLNLMNERAMFATFAAEQPSMEHDRVVDTLTHIWLVSIYGALPH